MRLFNWFAGTPGISLAEDQVWFTGEAKLHGICTEAVTSRATKDLVLIVAHFESTLEQVRETIKAYLHDEPLLAAAALSRRITDASPRDKGQVCALLMEDLQSAGIERSSGRTRGTAVVVAERYPIRAPDEALYELAKNLPTPCDVTFHVSLDDPLLKLFGDSERSRQLLAWVGADVSEPKPMVSRMFSRAVKRTQAAVARKMIGNSRSSSPEEWFRCNVPPLGQ